MHVYGERHGAVNLCGEQLRTGRPARATITDKGLQIEIDLHGVDPAFSGSMRLNCRKKIPDDALQKLPTRSLRFQVEPVFVYRAAGVRPES